MLSSRISSIHVHSVHASAPYAHVQHVLKWSLQIWNFYAYAVHVCKKLMHKLSVCILMCTQQTHQFLTRILRVRISSWFACLACFERTALSARVKSWHVCSMHAPVLDQCAQCTHQFLTRMFSARISNLNTRWGYTKWTFEIWENWCACWACA